MTAGQLRPIHSSSAIRTTSENVSPRSLAARVPVVICVSEREISTRRVALWSFSRRADTRGRPRPRLAGTADLERVFGLPAKYLPNEAIRSPRIDCKLINDRRDLAKPLFDQIDRGRQGFSSFQVGHHRLNRYVFATLDAGSHVGICARAGHVSQRPGEREAAMEAGFGCVRFHTPNVIPDIQYYKGIGTIFSKNIQAERLTAGKRSWA